MYIETGNFFTKKEWIIIFWQIFLFGWHQILFENLRSRSIIIVLRLLKTDLSAVYI